MQNTIIELFNNVWIFTAFVTWSMIWKGFALWRAGRNYNKGWFVVLFIVNTIGILEILYLFVFGKENPDTAG